MTQTSMTHLLWIIRIRFESQGNSSDSSRKQIFSDIFGECPYFIMKMYVMRIY